MKKIGRTLQTIGGVVATVIGPFLQLNSDFTLHRVLQIALLGLLITFGGSLLTKDDKNMELPAIILLLFGLAGFVYFDSLWFLIAMFISAAGISGILYLMNRDQQQEHTTAEQHSNM
ncbi:hypothetical protein KP77_31220 [Jeotgalibacillus alimentarius]|uniref:Uncharacterized protein n=1 Tax=Jeotgalibacillus alimentarius TaxID=135826 RepID=A0A0C2VFX7_9BACL|nr:hypothetical protein [Jeotgalibacillus alimentarius]KIL43416.1 hypothetical protein KP77_31220 [Jeotgalibacillus alimentarius]